MDFEVYTVKEVVGYGLERRAQADLPPVLRLERPDGGRARRPAYYTLQRQPRMLSARQRAQRRRARATSAARCSCRWSTPTRGPTDPACASWRSRRCAPTAICRCTCAVGQGQHRLHARVGRAGRDRPLPGGSDAAARLVTPTATPAGASSATCRSTICRWSTANAGAGEKARRAARAAVALRRRHRLERRASRSTACATTASAGITRALPVPGPTTFGRGLEVSVTCDEAAFEGSGVFLLGAVLERFFAKYVSINSFTETVLRTRAARGDHAMADEDRAAASHLAGARAGADSGAAAPVRRRRDRRRTAVAPGGASGAPGRAATVRRSGAGPGVAAAREGGGMDAILDQVARAPEAFDFFQVLRRLESLYCDRRSARASAPRRAPPTSRSASGQEPSLAFAPRALARRVAGQERRAAAAARSTSSGCSARTGRCRCTSPSTRASASATPTTRR